MVGRKVGVAGRKEKQTGKLAVTPTQLLARRTSLCLWDFRVYGSEPFRDSSLRGQGAQSTCEMNTLPSPVPRRRNLINTYQTETFIG